MLSERTSCTSLIPAHRNVTIPVGGVWWNMATGDGGGDPAGRRRHGAFARRPLPWCVLSTSSAGPFRRSVPRCLLSVDQNVSISPTRAIRGARIPNTWFAFVAF